MTSRPVSTNGFTTSRCPKPTDQPGIFSSSLLSVGSSLRTVGNRASRGLFQAVAAGYDHLTTDTSDKETVTFAKFSRLELRGSAGLQQLPVLLLGYETGFQIWDLQDCQHIRELVSRRDGAVRFIEPLPLPQQQPAASSPLHNAWPLLAIASSTDNHPTTDTDNAADTAHCVQLYSMHSHTYIHTLTFKSTVLNLTCSHRFIVVALDAQIHAFDASSLQHTFSVVTCSVAAALHSIKADSVPAEHTAPMALGSAWLAYASNQAVTHPTVQATPLSPSQTPLVRVRGSPRNGHTPIGYDSLSLYAKACAQQSGQHLKVLGEAGFKYLSGAVENWRAGANEHSAARMSPRGDQAKAESQQLMGTVMVRDVVNRQLIAHFRAHDSPLLCLQFDPSGTLLVTASLHGHNIHIFQICLGSGTHGSRGSAGPVGSAVHLYRLARGLTPAVIRGISWSGDGGWLGVSSARGTTHLFRVADPSSKDDCQPAHLAAANLARRRSRSASCNGLLTGQEAIKLSAVGRARAPGLLNGALPGSAAAAAVVNMYNGHTGGGEIAASFLLAQQAMEGPAHLQTTTSAQSAGPLQEDLFVMTAAAGLTRYRLRQQRSSPTSTSTDTVAGPLMDDRAPQEGSRDRGWGRDGDPPAVIAEPQERWDLCRHSTWPEREEDMSSSMYPHNSDHPANSFATAPHSSLHSSPHKPLPQGSTTSAWMVHAETQTCTSNSPLWADEHFAFLELAPPGNCAQQAMQPQHAQRAHQDQGAAPNSNLGQRPWCKMEELASRQVHTGRPSFSPHSQPPTMMFSAPLAATPTTSLSPKAKIQKEASLGPNANQLVTPKPSASSPPADVSANRTSTHNHQEGVQ